ncbi:hypothetical protein [Paractinoplanes rishiriensis]|uniref:DUF2637 domain-containing protein n=1 Tax=Paractinoplanes rishiriensis TaxID=1050105 RepID=A0A919JUA9_9ACTN|nr:hypothetical protein [Actinoplanes rishiriensis]GIE93318.1 hypothetical protein Ari01nite_07830 [Actinoplanes rishiriensis]
MTDNNSTGRGWAYTGAIIGGVVSIAANIAHSFVPPENAPADWAPQPGAVIGAIVWPVFLFVAVEILVRVAWPHGWSWRLVRFAGITPVALVAALVSYRHLSGLLKYYGEEPIVYIVGPLAADGLMVMATGALLAISLHNDNINPAPTTSLPTPAIPAIPDNRVPAPSPAADLPSPVTAPAAATAPPTVSAETDPEPAAARIEVPTPADVAARVTPSPTSIPLRPTARPAAAGTSKAKPRTTEPTETAQPLAASAADTSVTEPEPAQLPLPYTVDPALLVKAREIAKQYRIEHGTPITANQLAARLRVNSDQAAQALAVLDLEPNSPTKPIPTVNGTPVKATR